MTLFADLRKRLKDQQLGWLVLGALGSLGLKAEVLDPGYLGIVDRLKAAYSPAVAPKDLSYATAYVAASARLASQQAEEIRKVRGDVRVLAGPLQSDEILKSTGFNVKTYSSFMNRLNWLSADDSEKEKIKSLIERAFGVARSDELMKLLEEEAQKNAKVADLKERLMDSLKNADDGSDLESVRSQVKDLLSQVASGSELHSQLSQASNHLDTQVSGESFAVMAKESSLPKADDPETMSNRIADAMGSLETMPAGDSLIAARNFVPESPRYIDEVGSVAGSTTGSTPEAYTNQADTTFYQPYLSSPAPKAPVRAPASVLSQNGSDIKDAGEQPVPAAKSEVSTPTHISGDQKERPSVMRNLFTQLSRGQATHGAGEQAPAVSSGIPGPSKTSSAAMEAAVSDLIADIHANSKTVDVTQAGNLSAIEQDMVGLLGGVQSNASPEYLERLGSVIWNHRDGMSSFYSSRAKKAFEGQSGSTQKKTFEQISQEINKCQKAHEKIYKRISTDAAWGVADSQAANRLNYLMGCFGFISSNPKHCGDTPEAKIARQKKIAELTQEFAKSLMDAGICQDPEDIQDPQEAFVARRKIIGVMQDLFIRGVGYVKQEDGCYAAPEHLQSEIKKRQFADLTGEVLMPAWIEALTATTDKNFVEPKRSEANRYKHDCALLVGNKRMECLAKALHESKGDPIMDQLQKCGTFREMFAQHLNRLQAGVDGCSRRSFTENSFASRFLTQEVSGPSVQEENCSKQSAMLDLSIEISKQIPAGQFKVANLRNPASGCSRKISFPHSVFNVDMDCLNEDSGEVHGFSGDSSFKIPSFDFGGGI